jgi:hypothetical protein
VGIHGAQNGSLVQDQALVHWYRGLCIDTYHRAQRVDVEAVRAEAEQRSAAGAQPGRRADTMEQELSSEAGETTSGQALEGIPEATLHGRRHGRALIGRADT